MISRASARAGLFLVGSEGTELRQPGPQTPAQYRGKITVSDGVISPRYYRPTRPSAGRGQLLGADHCIDTGAAGHAERRSGCCRSSATTASTRSFRQAIAQRVEQEPKGAVERAKRGSYGYLVHAFRADNVAVTPVSINDPDAEVSEWR